MKVENIFKFIALICVFTPQIFSGKKNDFTFGIRFTNIECRTDNVTILLHYCFLKPYSRKIVTANIGVVFLKPLKNPTFIEIIYKYRYGTIYREVIRTPKLEWCTIMGGAASNPLVSSIMNEIKDSVPGLFQKCPYEGELDLKNITALHEKAAALFWDGYYKFELYVWRNNVEVFFLSLGTQCKTDLKDSFG